MQDVSAVDIHQLLDHLFSRNDPQAILLKPEQSTIENRIFQRLSALKSLTKGNRQSSNYFLEAEAGDISVLLNHWILVDL